MRYLAFFILICLTACSDEYSQKVQAFRELKNEEFSNPNTSPLPKHEIKIFTGLKFYPIDAEYRLEGVFSKSSFPRYFNLFEGTEVKQVHQQVGTVTFQLKGEAFTLLAFCTVGQAKDQLFIPFQDLSNQVNTYPGGRYVEALLISDSTCVIDFNLAYNPYCAYNEEFTCAACPKENKLDVAIKAGEQYFLD